MKELELQLVSALLQNPALAYASEAIARACILAGNHFKSPECLWLVTRARIGADAAEIFRSEEFRRQPWAGRFRSWFEKQAPVDAGTASSVAALLRKGGTP